MIQLPLTTDTPKFPYSTNLLCAYDCYDCLIRDHVLNLHWAMFAFIIHKYLKLKKKKIYIYIYIYNIHGVKIK